MGKTFLDDVLKHIHIIEEDLINSFKAEYGDDWGREWNECKTIGELYMKLAKTREEKGKYVQTWSNCCGTEEGQKTGYDFVMDVLIDLGVLGLLDDFIVHIRMKYSEDSDWTYENLLLKAEDGFHDWSYDWWEGQPYVQVLGAQRIEWIKIPNFKTLLKDSYNDEDYKVREYNT